MIDDGDFSRWFPSTYLNKNDGLVHIMWRNHGIRVQSYCRVNGIIGVSTVGEDSWVSCKRVTIHKRPHVPTCLWCVASGRGY